MKTEDSGLVTRAEVLRGEDVPPMQNATIVSGGRCIVRHQKKHIFLEAKDKG